MKKYFAFFRLRFTTGLQYRAAALAGIATQFAWGGLEILAFHAFYRTDASAFPMDFQATASYIWLQQSFFAMFMAWLMESEILDAIKNGNIAYEICRPIDIYHMWYARSAATRLSKVALRCFPVLFIAALLPAPFGLALPESPLAFFWFLITLLLGFSVIVAFTVLIYITCFFTISPQGIRIIATGAAEFFQGAIIPLPFFPDGVRQLMELLPFASMQNVPYRIYSGDIGGTDILQAVALQLFWLGALVLCGRLLTKKAMKKVVVQGG